MGKIYFTSDTHFGHANIIGYCNRPFQNVDEMDRVLIQVWNDEVSTDDTVYHLGDFTLSDAHAAQGYFRRLNGHIFVLGNAWHHDQYWLSAEVTFFSASRHAVMILPPLHVLEMDRLGDGKHPLAISLCHYPMAVWDRSHYGAWHLFGHSHNRYHADGFALDVGVDACGYRPISLDEVIWAMRERGWEKVGQ